MQYSCVETESISNVYYNLSYTGLGRGNHATWVDGDRSVKIRYMFLTKWCRQ